MKRVERVILFSLANGGNGPERPLWMNKPNYNLIL